MVKRIKIYPQGMSSSLLLLFNHRVISNSFATPQTIAHQVPLSMRFSRQEYWSGLPFSSPGYLHDPGIKPSSVASPTLAGRFFTTVPPGKPPNLCYRCPNKYRFGYIPICMSFSGFQEAQIPFYISFLFLFKNI